MSVPILDAAYMKRRASQRSMEAWFSSMHRFGVSQQRVMPDAPDTPESLRELYAADKLTFEQFEARLEKAL